MPFIGNQPAESYSAFQKQDFSTSATTSYTLDNPVANANELALFINFVRQEPTTAYSASGTSLTLTSATASSDDMYCVYLGKAVQTVNPPNASVGTSQLASSLDLSSKTVTLASNMTNTPAFRAEKASNQNIPNETFTKVTFTNEIFDTDSAYSTTDSRFTVPTGMGGKYFIGANITVRNGGDINTIDYAIYINGSQDDTYRRVHDYMSGSSQTQNSTFGFVLELSAADYVEIYNWHNAGGNLETNGYSSNNGTFWFAYKIIE